jgi:uncharacterized membrane protein YphA (DoxX/SURF4 family)
MNITLWIIQVVLAAIFFMAGIMKLTQPKEKLSKQLPWVNDLKMSTVRVIGLAELLGAIGLIIPWLTGFVPVLTPVSAIGICLIMVLATNIIHLGKKEYGGVAFNIVLFLLAGFVAYGRLNWEV